MAPTMLPMAVFAFLLASSAHAGWPFLPTINIGPTCTPACTNLTSSAEYMKLDVGCFGCLIQSGWYTNTINNVNQTMGTVRKLPLYEMGHSDLPAVVATQMPPYFQAELGRALFMARMDMAQAETELEICYTPPGGSAEVCETRALFPSGIIPSATSPTNFCYNGPLPWSAVDPSCTGLTDPLRAIGGVRFNSFEDATAALLTPFGGKDIYYNTMADQANKLMRDVDYAADSFWNMQMAFSQVIIFKSIGPSELSFLEDTFGDDWTAGMTQLLNDGKLAITDMSFLFDVNAPSTVLQPVPIAVSERVMVDGGVVQRVRIIKLHDNVQGRNPDQVYTPTKSPTAFILAMKEARSTVAVVMVNTGHIYHTHHVSAAMAYALYNNIQPERPVGQASHPLRRLLDENCEASRTWAQVAAFSARGPQAYPVYYDLYIGLQMHGIYKTMGPEGVGAGHLKNLYPEAKLALTGLKVEDYTSEGGEDWDLFQQAHMTTNLFRIIRNYTGQVINTYYKKNDEVRSDREVQAFAEALMRPDGANMGEINAANAINTKNQLADVAAFMLYAVLTHSLIQPSDFQVDFRNQILYPFGAFATSLPNPTAEYSEADMLKDWMPTNLLVAAQTVTFYYLAQPSPSGSWIKKTEDGEPAWDANLPFPNNKQGDRANAALVHMRKSYLEFLRDMPLGTVRSMATNADWPFNVGSNIDT